MALKVTRSTGTPFSTRFSFSASSTCQEIASPSRSGSVARMSFSAPFTARAISETRLAPRLSSSQIMRKSSSGSTEPSFGGQVADMPEGGQDLVALAEILVDRLGLGGRLDDDDLHGATAWECKEEGERNPRSGSPVQGALTWCGNERESISPFVTPNMGTASRDRKGRSRRALRPVARLRNEPQPGPARPNSALEPSATTMEPRAPLDF